MKTKKIIRYRIPVSVNFPATHPRKEEPTLFIEKIKTALQQSEEIIENGHCFPEMWDFKPKLHTIRGNYALWAKRFEKIMAGEAVLELYSWSGRPYASKAVIICQLGKDDGIGVQKLIFEEMIMCPSNQCFEVLQTTKDGGHVRIYRPKVGEMVIEPSILSKNDGLTIEDFRAWFKGYDLSEPMAIIHFTPFRY